MSNINYYSIQLFCLNMTTKYNYFISMFSRCIVGSNCKSLHIYCFSIKSLKFKNNLFAVDYIKIEVENIF